MPRKQKIEGGLLYREVQVGSGAIIDKKARIISLSFSSEEPVVRSSFFEDSWVEVLGHDAGEVDLSRLNTGAPLLYNHKTHDEDARLGVVESAEIINSRGEATVKFSKRNKKMDEVWRDIEDNILCNVSVGYQILERTLIKEHEDAPNEYRVTKWLPRELSIVHMPADITVGVGRSDNYTVVDIKGGMDMPSKKEEQVRDDNPVIDTGHEAVNADSLRAEFKKDEATRQADITASFAPHMERQGVRDLLDECRLNLDVTVQSANERLLAQLGKEATPSVRVEVGKDERELKREQMQNAIEFRAGLTTEDNGNEIRGYSMAELARLSLRFAGGDDSGSRLQMMGRAITHSTSDFANVLANVANKSMLKGYGEAPETFEAFTSVGNLSDFKATSRVGMSEFGDLDEIGAGGEYKSGTFSDKQEKIQLLTFGKKFTISRQALINDDLSAFTTIPSKMGRAARRKVGDLAYAVLTDNPIMADGVALFHNGTHGNNPTAAAMSIASFGAARTAMAKQTDISGKAVLNIRPATLIVPVALEDLARTLMASETDPSQANSRKPNIYRGAFEVVSDARLDVVSAKSWYLAANASQFDTIEIGYLDGNQNPFLEQQDGWDVDGVEFKVRIDAAAKALEHRTLLKNNGV